MLEAQLLIPTSCREMPAEFLCPPAPGCGFYKTTGNLAGAPRHSLLRQKKASEGRRFPQPNDPSFVTNPPPIAPSDRKILLLPNPINRLPSFPGGRRRGIPKVRKKLFPLHGCRTSKGRLSKKGDRLLFRSNLTKSSLSPFYVKNCFEILRPFGPQGDANEA